MQRAELSGVWGLNRDTVVQRLHSAGSKIEIENWNLKLIFGISAKLPCEWIVSDMQSERDILKRKQNKMNIVQSHTLAMSQFEVSLLVAFANLS